MLLGIDISRANKIQRTGVEWYSYSLIQEFKKIIPADARVILYMQDKPQADLLTLPQNWEIKILRWPFKFWTIFRLSAEMLLHKPDIFFSPANILPFFTPKKTFTTIHDIGFKKFPESYPAVERWLQDFGAKRALKKSAVIFTPSEFTKREIIDVYKMYSIKIIVTALGRNPSSVIPLDRGRDGGVDILEKYNIKKPYFLFIGRKEKKKNINSIIEAFRIFQEKNPNYFLVLAGPEKKLLITNYQLPITSLDWLPKNELDALLREATAFLFPSLYEGFGLPILEAFDAGVPVITSNRASMPEVAGDAAILIDPQNPQQIVEAMEKIIKDFALRAKLVARGKKRLDLFSWEKCAKITLGEMLNKKEESVG